MDKSMAFALNVKALREDSGLTQAEFGETLGLKGVTISKWERGEIRRPHPPMVDLISSEYSVSADDLLGENGYYAKTRGIKKPQEPKSAATTLPIAGVTHAGYQSPAYEVTGDAQWCPPEYAKEGNFYIRVSGDSMNNALMDGQYALIDTHHEVKSGDIALVKVNGDDATIKRVELLDGVIFLEPDSTNPAHKRRIIDETDPDSPEVRLIGKVVYAITKF